ncbi:hypothetical protein STENM223S_11498 [Streptomyces tendae]
MGQLIHTDDSRPDADAPSLWYSYDGLGRKTELRENSTTGPLRAEWVYDTISGAKGHLAESTRYDDGNAYTSEVVTYDRLYRPQRTSITIPAAEGALQGTYLSTATYNVAGMVQGTGYPKAGGLPATSVTYTYETDSAADRHEQQREHKIHRQLQPHRQAPHLRANARQQ